MNHTTPPSSDPEATRLAAKVAHELNNPLDAVLRFVSLAQRKAKSGDYSDVDRHLADAQFGLQRMAEILRELMDIGRQTHDLLARQGNPAASALPLAELLARATRTTAALAEQKHITVAIENRLLAETVPCFDLRVAQILSNLLKNALEASPDASTVIVTLGLSPPPLRQLLITVADAGQGLPPDLLPRLFTPFVTTKDEGIGHGLGLAISRELALSLHGALTLDNRPPPHSGCIATLTLPLP